MLRRLLAVASIAAMANSGCYARETSVKTVHGTARSFETPKDATAPPRLTATANENGVQVVFAGAQCVTRTETPISTTEVTVTTMKPAAALALAGLGLGLGALGYATWQNADEQPEECPETDESCNTREGTQAAAVVMWGLGAAAIGFAGYKFFSPDDVREVDKGKSITATDSPPHACSTDGTVVVLRLPDGAEFSARTDPSGSAMIGVPDSAIGAFRRSARGEIWVDGQRLDTVELAPLISGYQRRLGIEPGVLVASDVVAASGQILGRLVRLDVSLSPQDGAKEFIGGTFTRESFSIEQAAAHPARGGAPIPLTMSVNQIAVSAPRTGGSAALLLFDSSGSMQNNDPGLEGRLAAARAFLSELQGSTDVAVLDFGVGATDQLKASRILQSFTRDTTALEASFARLLSSGGTPLYPAVNDALSLLEREQKNGAIVLLTDGQAGGPHDATVQRAKAAGVPIYSVGLGSNLDFKALRSLGIDTGGFFVEAAQRDALASAFKGVAIGISVGTVRVTAESTSVQALTPGAYMVRGNVVTADSGSGKRVAQPFEFSATAQ